MRSVPMANTGRGIRRAPRRRACEGREHTATGSGPNRAGLWGLLWVLYIKMAATGEQSCYRHIFELRL